MKKLVIVPDTNFYIHFKNIDEINWVNLFEDKFTDIHAIVLPAVLTELDNHKYSERPKLRERAIKVTKLIERALLHNDGACLKNGLKIDFFKPDIDFIESDTKNMDDKILDCCKYINERKSSNETLIVITHDTGLKLKLKSNNITYIDLGDEYKLQPEKSKEQIELDRIKKELSSLKNRQPQLSLFEGPNNKKLVEFSIKPSCALSQQEIEKEVSRIKDKIPLKKINNFEQSNILESLGTYINKIPNTDLENYNLQVKKFYQQWEEFYKNNNEFENIKKRVLPLHLVLENSGTLPATNVDLNLHITVSKEVKLFDEYDYKNFLKKLHPKEPMKPQEPMSLLESIRQNSDLINHNFLIPNMVNSNMINTEPVNISSPKITPTNSYNVFINIKNIKHHTTLELDKMYLIFPNHSYSDSFKIEYKILSDELPNPSYGEINFINKKP